MNFKPLAIKEPKFPQDKTGMYGVYVAGSGVHGYFHARQDAEAYKTKMHNSGCYYVPVFQYGDSSNYWR